MTTLYGIPNCDTVRKAKDWLTKNEINFQFYDFRKTPLLPETIQNWLSHQPIEVLVNKRSTGWKQLSESQKLDLMQNQNISYLIETPTLIKRPVLDTLDKQIFGFNETEYQILTGAQ